MLDTWGSTSHRKFVSSPKPFSDSYHRQIAEVGTQGSSSTSTWFACILWHEGAPSRRNLPPHAHLPSFRCLLCPPPQGPGSDIFKLVVMAMSRGYDPLIVFSFSKRECESLALSLGSLDLNSSDEKQLVEGIFK